MAGTVLHQFYKCLEFLATVALNGAKTPDSAAQIIGT
jgi:hypothetical protein